MQPHDTTQEIPYGYCKCGCGEKTSLATVTRPNQGWIKGQPVYYIRNHNRRIPTQPAIAKLCECGCGQLAPIAKRNNPRKGYIKGQPTRFVRNHGTGTRTKTSEERFWQNVMPGAWDECWLWQGRVNAKGYGSFWANGHEVAVHRFSYELHTGPIPDGVWVLHKCDNPPCCNPYHFFLGANQDNVNDKVQKGRHAHRLSGADKDEICRLRAQGVMRNDVAKQFGINPVYVSKIVRKRSR